VKHYTWRNGILK